MADEQFVRVFFLVRVSSVKVFPETSLDDRAVLSSEVDCYAKSYEHLRMHGSNIPSDALIIL